MQESLIQNEDFLKVTRNEIIFVPIPLGKRRFKSRGYNQAEILSKELSKIFGFPVIDGISRNKETITQVGLDKSQRKENVKGVFKVINKYSGIFKNSRVVLVDDVLTTGSTFSEVASVLLHNRSREVQAVALAKEN